MGLLMDENDERIFGPTFVKPFTYVVQYVKVTPQLKRIQINENHETVTFLDINIFCSKPGIFGIWTYHYDNHIASNVVVILTTFLGYIDLL